MNREPQWLTLPPTPVLPGTNGNGYAPVNGIEIRYAMFGRGEPVILLHGGLANSNYWGNHVPVLAKDYQVIVIDSRVHGRSSRNEKPFAYELMASDVIGLMDYLKIQKAMANFQQIAQKSSTETRTAMGVLPYYNLLEGLIHSWRELLGSFHEANCKERVVSIRLQSRERTMVCERSALLETRPHSKVLSIPNVYALFRANEPAFEYLGFWQTHAHCERQSLRLQPAILYRVQQPHKCSLGCAGNPHHSNHAKYA
jgi:hypothetical protein